MCFSAEASFTAAAALIPAGALSFQRAYRTDRRYLPIATLPLLFGLQQALEGGVWIANGNAALVERLSLGYMFFSWLAWPVWIPFATYFLEPCRRRHVYLLFAILGGMLGAIQYFPYFAHDGWLETQFLPLAISYQGTVLFDFIMRREITYAIYLFAILAPLLTSSNKHMKVFGALITAVVIVTYLFFEFAYISVFCFGGALMSIYIVYVVNTMTTAPSCATAS